MKFRLAVAQIDSRIGDVQYNLQHHVERIEKAKREGADVILFPELSLTGYTLRDLAWECALNVNTSSLLDPLRALSKEISIVVGLVESGPDRALYNAAVFLEDGSVNHVHRKVYPPTYGMFEEGRYFSAGKTVRAFNSKHGRFGMLICEDCWHLSLPYVLAVDGADVLFCLTASPTRISGEGRELQNAEMNHEHHRVYARLLSSYVAFCNRVGFEDGVNFWGGSLVVGPAGHPLATARLFEEDVILADIDEQELLRARRFSRHFLDEDPHLTHQNLLRALEEKWRRS